MTVSLIEEDGQPCHKYGSNAAGGDWYSVNVQYVL